MSQETAQMRAAREHAEKSLVQALENLGWPTDAFGTPLARISCSAAELIPHKQFGNLTVGPVQVTRFVPDASDEELKAHILRTQRLCDEAVAEDSLTLHEQIRNHARAGT